MEKNNNIGEVYKKAFEDFEATPSPETWTRIEKSLGKKSLFQQYKLPLFSLAGAIVLLSAYLFFKPNVTTSNQLQEASLQTINHQPAEILSSPVIDSIENNNTISSEEENIQLSENKENKTNTTKEIKPIRKNNTIQKNNQVTNTASPVIATSSDSIIPQKTEPSIHQPLKNEEVIIVDIIEPNIIEEDTETIIYAEESPLQTVDDENDIVMPNAFSLNGINYTSFKPLNTCETCHSFEMVIYSKTGEIIFRTKDIKNGWNGTYKGNQVKTDTYLYVLSYKKGADDKIKRGYIVVVP